MIVLASYVILQSYVTGRGPPNGLEHHISDATLCRRNTQPPFWAEQPLWWRRVFVVFQSGMVTTSHTSLAQSTRVPVTSSRVEYRRIDGASPTKFMQHGKRCNGLGNDGSHKLGQLCATKTPQLGSSGLTPDPHSSPTASQFPSSSLFTSSTVLPSNPATCQPTRHTTMVLHLSRSRMFIPGIICRHRASRCASRLC